MGKSAGAHQNKAYKEVNNSHKGFNQLIIESSYFEIDFFVFSIEYRAITKKGDYFQG